MTRLVGSVLVVAGCAFFGFQIVRRLDRRVRRLAELCAALRYARTEIGSRHAPLPELLLSLEKQYPGLNALWEPCLTGWKPWAGQSFAVCWERGLRRLELREPEFLILLEVGGFMGRYDAERQAEALEAAVRQLERQLESARDERARHGKLCAGLGLVSGLMAVILLL
jgi:stage III sporulation protein AB